MASETSLRPCSGCSDREREATSVARGHADVGIAQHQPLSILDVLWFGGILLAVYRRALRTTCRSGHGPFPDKSILCLMRHE